MKIQYRNPGMQSMIESVLAFQTDGESAYWLDGLYAFYPQIDKDHARSLRFDDRCRYLSSMLEQIYRDNETVINEKIDAYQQYWQQNKRQVEDALSEIFEMDCWSAFQDLICDVSINPISPRFLKERRFEVFFLNSEKGALGMSLHEIIHFVWFDKWNQMFKDHYDEYERPTLKWILSEMVVETLMKDPRLSSLNPYFPREGGGGCIYSYFFNMKAGNDLVLEKIDAMHDSLRIGDFMKESYQYLLQHETEIRQHIEIEEAKGW